VETRIELNCQFGKFSKQVKLSMISNAPASQGEFEQLKSNYQSSGSKFIDKRYCALKKKQLDQLTSGNLT